MIETSTTYNDKIDPNEAVAKLPPEERTQAVIEKYEGRPDEARKRAEGQPKPEEVQESLNQIEANEDRAKATLATAENEGDVAETGLNQFGIVRNFTGKRTSEERSADVDTATSELKDVQDNKSKAEAGLKDATTYSKDYWEKQGDDGRNQELIRANEKGGPVAASKEMSQALHDQAITQEMVKLMDREGMETKYIPQAELVEIFPALVRERNDFSPAFNREQVLVILATMNQELLKIADELGIKVNLDTLKKSFLQGFKITEGAVGSDVGNTRRFVEKKLGHTPWSNLRGYYDIGAFQLDRLFKQNQTPESSERIPHVIAYACGAMLNGNVQHQNHHLRDWLSEVFPVETTQKTWDAGEEKEESVETTLGLGHFVGSEGAPRSWRIDQSGTQDEVEEKAITQAHKIVKQIEEALNQSRSIYQAASNFRDADIETPFTRDN